MPLRMRPRRRLISLSPRYLLTWQCRRLSTVSVPHPWTLLCRRSHAVLFLRTFLRRWVLAQLPRFLSTRLSRLLHAVLYHTILPHNYRSRSSLLDVSSLTILFDRQSSSSAQGDIDSVSMPPLPDIATTCTLSSSGLDSDDHVRTLAPRVLLQPPLGLEQYAAPPGLEIDAHLCASHGIPVKAAPLRPRLRSAICHAHSLLFVPFMWEHILCAQLPFAQKVLHAVLFFSAIKLVIALQSVWRPVPLSVRVACHQGWEAHLEPGPTPWVC